MKSITVAAILFAMARPAFAAWASGGGQIHRDSQNPWFLENTKVVRYCVEVDEANFGVASVDASTEIKNALSDWLAAFSTAEDSYYSPGELKPYGQLRVGTQVFQEYSCSDGADFDLRFQLGRLTSEQEKLFANPREYVGVAVRTDYNQKTLKGRGFIYLAPVSGPLAPDHPRLDPKAWTRQQKFSLKSVLRHELGHVFGVDHQPDSVMDEKWPELFVDKTFLDGMTEPVRSYFERRLEVMKLFGLKKNWLVEGCGQRNPVFAPSLFQRRYAENSCGRVSLQRDHLTLEFREETQAHFEMVGTATLTGTHTNSSQAISVYLPSGQQVFSKVPSEAQGLGRLFGETRHNVQKWQGVIQIPSTQEHLPLQIESDAHKSSGTVLKDGHFENDVFFLE